MRQHKFGPYQFLADIHELFDDGKKVPLRRQCSDVLSEFFEQEGELVTYEQLRDLLWPSQPPSDVRKSIQMTVVGLKKALKPPYNAAIRAVAGRGYVFSLEGTEPPDAQREQPVPAVRNSENHNALDALALGEERFLEGGLSGLNTAIESFEIAVKLDPTLVAAQCRLAQCFLLLGSWWYGAILPGAAYSAARFSATAAIAYSGGNEPTGDAEAILIAIQMLIDHDLGAAKARFNTLIEKHTRSALAYYYYAQCLAASGELDAAMLAAQQCVDIDPTPASYLNEAYINYLVGRFGNALSICDRMQHLFPKCIPARILSAFISIERGSYREARAKLVRAAKWDPRLPLTRAAFGHLRDLKSSSPEAKRAYGLLLKTRKRAHFSTFYYAFFAAGAKKTSDVLRFLDSEPARQIDAALFIRCDPRWRRVRNAILGGQGFEVAPRKVIPDKKGI